MYNFVIMSLTIFLFVYYNIISIVNMTIVGEQTAIEIINE